MERDHKSIAKPKTVSGPSQRPPSTSVPGPIESIEEIGWGDSILSSLRTQLFHGFRADFENDAPLWAATTRVIVHAIRTFGSEEKAYDWLVSKCGALDSEVPYDLLKAGKTKTVDEELDRIDYGIYV